MSGLSKRQAATEQKKHEAQHRADADTIFNSPAAVVLGTRTATSPSSSSSTTIAAMQTRPWPTWLDLMKSDPKLKVVLKEFPVLSEGSVDAAKVAVAVRKSDPSGKKYLDFHQKLLGGRGRPTRRAPLAAAKEAGLDTARIEKESRAGDQGHHRIEFQARRRHGHERHAELLIGKQS